MSEGTFLKSENDLAENNILQLAGAKANDYIKIDTIVRCQSNNDNCTIYLNNGNMHTYKIKLNEIEIQLSKFKFIKIYPIHIVNTAFINRYIKNENILVMYDGTQLPISANKRKLILSLSQN